MNQRESWYLRETSCALEHSHTSSSPCLSQWRFSQLIRPFLRRRFGLSLWSRWWSRGWSGSWSASSLAFSAIRRRRRSWPGSRRIPAKTVSLISNRAQLVWRRWCRVSWRRISRSIPLPWKARVTATTSSRIALMPKRMRLAVSAIPIILPLVKCSKFSRYFELIGL